MPKKKTNKSAAKRFRVTAGGRLKYFKSGRRHLLGSKTRKTKRQMRRPGIVARVDEPRIRELLPS